jgi:hypothetical protein
MTCYARGTLGAMAMKSAQEAKTHRVLVIDTGGTNIKLLATGEKELRKIPSGPTMTAAKWSAKSKTASGIGSSTGCPWDIPALSLTDTLFASLITWGAAG